MQVVWREHLEIMSQTWDNGGSQELLGVTLAEGDNGGSQESMGVTLALTHNIGNIEPKKTISCGQAGMPVCSLHTNESAKLSVQNTEGISNQ